VPLALIVECSVLVSVVESMLSKVDMLKMSKKQGF